jgi:multiple sugar transport system ATP-binding protein
MSALTPIGALPSGPRPPHTTPAVRFAGVTKAFGRATPVLRDVDLAVDTGAFVTLIGPSGCGKSTMLNLIAGFERPTAGEVLLDGEVVNDRSPRERGAAMVFQSYALYPHLDVFHNIAFPLQVAGVHKAEVGVRVREVAARLGLDRLLERRPRELSGGQRQRVALGRALVRRPRLCLFDEPLSNLDAGLRGHMRAEIKKIHEQSGATFVYVTHDQAEAMTLSDVVVVLSGGVVQQAAPPRVVYSEPANMFVAGFIGMPRINLIRPETLRVPDTVVRGRAVVIGARPEDLAVGLGAAPEGAVAGRVYVVEPMGAETWVTVEVAGERVIGRAPADFSARSGELVWMKHDEGKVLLFDARTERRIER